MVRVLILRAAGTNCDLETEWAFRLAGAKPQRVHLSRIIRNEVKLKDYDVLVIPGGFSYGDDLGAGKVLANEILYKVWDQFELFIAGKKPVIGICNGFQVLTKTGMVPFSGKSGASLAWNDSGHYEDRWVYLKTEKSISPFFKNLPEIIRLPVAHAEGKFILKNRNDMRKLEKNGQIIFRYVDPSGHPAAYPYNPNGSFENIAGVCNETGLVFGMMPHPERALLGIHLPDWTGRGFSGRFSYGFQIFKNVIEYVS